MRFEKRSLAEVAAGLDGSGVDEATLAAAGQIVADVRARGEAGLRHHAERLGDVAEGAPLILRGEALAAAKSAVSSEVLGVLERTAARIETFAARQRAALEELTVAVPGGTLGHEVAPVSRAGCYAPGGRYPLPSSVLMTAVTARAAGVEEVWVASPRPTPVTLAAAAVAGADAVLMAGGAQAIAAFGFGAGDVPACDAIVGPGNRWVTAAKQQLAGRVAIDMLAGPSEVLIIADEKANPAVVAADLLAQCEHDTDARGLLVTSSAALVEAVTAELERQLATLPTRETAEVALENGGYVLVKDLAEACEVSDAVAPEHLELLVEHPDGLRPRLHHYGALFIGEGAAEVLGDYGVGPNHTLPTGGTARSFGGLSVHTFLRVRTFMQLDGGAAPEVLDDVVALARLEGLEAHARAAELRRR